jgi:signal transduction histidine kinase/ligand-binding sensor domain-containing protein
VQKSYSVSICRAASAHRWLATTLLLWCTATWALGPNASIRDLQHTAWGPKQGAPDAIFALAQTTDGYLWMGNGAGLFRFDGLNFEQISLPPNDRVQAANVFSLFAPASGGLWIGFAFGGIAFFKDGQTQTYSVIDGLPKGSVTSIAQDMDGTVWAGTAIGLAKLQGSRWQAAGPETNYTGADPQALLVDSTGTLWVLSSQKLVQLRKGEALFREVMTLPVVAGNASAGIAESPTGEVWVLRGDEHYLAHKNSGSRRQTGLSSGAALFDRDRNLWVLEPGGDLKRITGLDSGVSSFQLGKSSSTDRFLLSDGRSSAGGSGAMLEDREGNVWVSSNVGLDRFTQRHLKSILPILGKEAPKFNLVDAALAPGDDGALWLGGASHPVISLRDGKVQRHESIPSVTCAIRAEDGALWIAGRQGLAKYSSGQVEMLALPEGTKNEVQAITQDRFGGLWVSIVRQGLHRLDKGVWTAWGGVPSLPRWTALSLTTDAAGKVWFGYPEGRMAVLDGNEVRVFSEQTKLPVGNVLALYAKRGNVWAGGDFGLARFDGTRFQALMPATPGMFSNITGIIETAEGDLWVNGGAGVVRVAAIEQRRAAQDGTYRVRGEVFGVLDGVQGSSARIRPLPTAVEGTDGRLWFLRNVDIYSLMPSRIVRNPVPPPVLIRSVTADGQAYAPAAELRLPPRTGSLRIEYAGLSLTLAEKVRYRYRLEGVDKAWQEAQGRREASYTNLAPGTHRFQVVAANNDGVWNETGATLDFVIAPAFVQTGWFIALCAAGVSLAAWLVVRIRVGQVSARLRMRHAERMAERERIARELHDTLLQSTQGLIFRFQAVAMEIPKDNPARAKLEQALDRADVVVAEGRDRVLDLRVAADSTQELPEAFAAAGKELAQGRTASFSITVDGVRRGILLSVGDEAYRIGREALLNAFRHADAGSIEVQIVYESAALRICIRDDGDGIDPVTLESGSRPGHWGLQGMRERAQRIGGHLEISSRPGAGTEIELCVPAALAFRESARPPRWQWRRLKAWRAA